MYPVIRLVWQLVKTRNAPPLHPTETHISRHMCLPWDIDIWMELNNGRTLTLYDIGRTPFALRSGLIRALRQNRWGMTMAGASVRYRRRIRMFETVEMRTRVVFWDSKFIYLEQSMWKKDGECANHIVYRSAVTGKDGIVDPVHVAEATGIDPAPPKAPAWVLAWIEADQLRPWPPMQEDLATLDRS